MDKSGQEWVRRVGNERLAAEGRCFPTPEFNHPFPTLYARWGVKNAPRKYRDICCEHTQVQPAVCVSLLGECHFFGCDRMEREQAKVAQNAKVTGGCDHKTYSFASVPLITTLEFTSHIAEKGFT